MQEVESKCKKGESRCKKYIISSTRVTDLTYICKKNVGEMRRLASVYFRPKMLINMLINIEIHFFFAKNV